MDNTKKVPVLRFPEFSGEWESKKLGNIADLTSSKRVYLSDYVSEGIPFYRGKEISELKRNETPKDILYITRESYEVFKSNFGIPQINDILITAVGTLGNVYRIKNNSEFYFKDGNLIWLRNVKILSDFLEILLETNQEAIQKSSIGSTQRALTIIELKKLFFNTPSFPEQQKIADFLTQIDNKINQLSQKKQLLERYKKGVMQQIFSQEIRFTDDDGREFPEWEEKKLGDIGKFMGGGTPSKSVADYWQGNIPWVSSSDITEDDILNIKISRFINENSIKESATKIIPKGSILFVSRVGVGKLAINREDVCTSQDFTNFIPKTSDSYYLGYYFIANKNILISFNQGTSIKGFTKNDIENINLSLPCKPEQTKIANFLTAIDEKIALVEKQLHGTKQYKKGLLQQLFV